MESEHIFCGVPCYHVSLVFRGVSNNLLTRCLNIALSCDLSYILLMEEIRLTTCNVNNGIFTISIPWKLKTI